MNRLPQDIFDEIAALLQSPDFDGPALATISRQWQRAIERHTFRNIRLRSTDLDRFQDVVQQDRRRYVHAIDYLVILPTYGGEERCRFEREVDRQANDEAFTAAIYGLFYRLESWDVSKDGHIRLYLRDIYSNADHPSLRRSCSSRELKNFLRVDRTRRSNLTVDLWRWRFRYSYLRLLRASELPLVPIVNSFYTCATTRNICDRVSIDMAARLPNLREASWRMNDWEIRYIALRRAHRHDLAQAVTEVLPRSSVLQSLTLFISSACLWAPDFSSGTLDLGNSTRDTLSDAIRTATGGMSTLRELWIAGTIDGSLLWPGPAHAVSHPYWQNLEYITVNFDARRPSGGCYFWNSQVAIRGPLEAEVPPGYGLSEEEDAEAAMRFSPIGHLDGDGLNHETAPDDDSLVPLIEAFGKACLQMPKLQSAELSSLIPAPVELEPGTMRHGRCRWGIWYLSPGTSLHVRTEEMDPVCSEDIHQRRLFWDVREWRPNTELQNLLRDIGSKRYGTDLVEKFIDTWSTVGKEMWLQYYKKQHS
ncbi:hypothetical protein MKZ38_000513 [Zalerion maritima]|uniref:F-box domain-containing protein n=1 Tax=Zalerion maritima TaxID=339359 RepID=A0AAD5WLN7_9PEZI|nr:hypothetical protein MKZ38_000513 [Zalerion maritima]